MKQNINLNDKKGTYSNCISNNIQTIYGLYNSHEVDAVKFRNKILKITELANDTPAKRRFITAISKKRTKDEILFYVSNVVLSAQHLCANPDSKWSNEK